MNISKKLILLSLLLMLLFSGAFLALRTLEMGRLSSLIEVENRNKEAVYDAIIKIESSLQGTFASDYSYWEEMVNFVTTQDEDWARETIEAGLNTYKSNAAWVYNPNNSLVYSINNLKDPGLKKLPVSEGDISKLFVNPHSCHFFTYTSKGLMEIYGYFIQPSADVKRETPALGYFFCGLLWDNAHIEHISMLTGTEITVAGISKEDLPSPVLSKAKAVSFSRILNGFTQEPVARLDISAASKNIEDFEKTSFQASILFLCFSIVTLLIFLFAITRWVNAPLRQITLALKESDPVYVARMKNDRSEFGSIAGLVDNFFVQRFKLQESEERFRQFAVASSCGFVMGDLTGRLVFANAATLNIVEEERVEDFSRKTAFQYLAPRDTERMKKEIFPFIIEHGQWVGEIPLLSAKGNLVLTEQNIFLIRDERGAPRMVGNIITDITDRKQAEATVRHAFEEAKQANRAKGDFLTHMSHEIRTPLNGIMGFAQIIARSKDVNQRERKQAEQITAECGKLLELINQLLDLAKIEAGKMEVDAQNFSLQTLMDDITSAFNAAAAEKNIGFTVSVHADVPGALNGDEMHLRQVLINLIGNAIKFTQEGGVSVSINSSEETGNRVKLMFSVIDTGIGISKEKLGIIFESFTQADSATTREYGGSGLGTTICRQLVELMGGEIGAESELGKGSTFWFALPFEKASPAKAQEASPESAGPPASLNHARVLVVEDYPTNQEVAKYLIESAEGVVTIAENGQVALEMFKEGVFDIILMDVQMPKMDGYEATREIRKLPGGAGIPIIGMTANVFEKDRQACLAAGMDDFLPKPLELGRFISTVARWLAPSGMAGQAAPEKTADSDAATCQADGRNMPVDVEAYVKRMGGNRDIAGKIIRGFIEQIPVQLCNIEEAIKSGDIETVGREAHSIKGGALNVFANDMMLAAKALEMQAKSGSLEDTVGLLEKIRAECARLVEFEAGAGN